MPPDGPAGEEMGLSLVFAGEVEFHVGKILLHCFELPCRFRQENQFSFLVVGNIPAAALQEFLHDLLFEAGYPTGFVKVDRLV